MSSRVWSRARVVAIMVVVLAITGLLVVLFLAYSGVYNVSALRQHTQPVYALLEDALHISIEHRTREIEPPDLDTMDWRDKGLSLYDQHCRRCHGAPGTAPDNFALGLTPLPTALVSAGRHLSPAEVFWVVQQGIKMSGMPAWEYRLSDREIWHIVAFVKRAPYLSVMEYRALARAAGRPVPDPPPSPATPQARMPGSAAEGRQAIQQYGCIGCHRIPGITGATADVGPPLTGVANRAFIAGRLPNTRENMIRWLRSPQQVDPHSAMPSQGVKEQEAIHMAVYLETLKSAR